MAKYINPLCEAARMMMDEYACGELGGEDGEAFEAHLRMCSDCRHEYEFLLRMKKLLADAEMPPPEGLHEKIVAALANERKNQAKSRRIKMITRYSATAAGVVLILALGVSGIYKSVVNKASDNAAWLESSPTASLAEPETSAETYAGENLMKSAGLTTGASDSAEAENDTDAAANEAPMMMMAPAANAPDEAVPTEEETLSDKAYDAQLYEAPVEEAAPEVAADEEEVALPEAMLYAVAPDMPVSVAFDRVFTATASMSSMLYDAPYVERVNDLEYVKALLNEGDTYGDWYNNVWRALTDEEKAYEPALYRAIRDYDIPRETVEDAFLFVAPDTPEALEKLYSDLILTNEYIDALYEDDITEMRRLLVNPFALYYNGAIYTYFWLVSCSETDFADYAPDAVTLNAYAMSMSQFFNTDALAKRLEKQ